MPVSRRKLATSTKCGSTRLASVNKQLMVLTLMCVLLKVIGFPFKPKKLVKTSKLQWCETTRSVLGIKRPNRGTKNIWWPRAPVISFSIYSCQIFKNNHDLGANLQRIKVCISRIKWACWLGSTLIEISWTVIEWTDGSSWVSAVFITFVC